MMIQRSIPLLAGLLMLQLVAAVGLGLRGRGASAAAPEQPLVPAAVTSADHLVIEGPKARDSSTAPARIELALHDGRWTVPAQSDLPADTTRINGLLSRLAALRSGLPIATSSEALDRFAVEPGHFVRRLVAERGGKPVATLLLGESAGLRKTAARNPQDKAVQAIALGADDLPTAAGDWLDHGLLQRKAETIARIGIELAGHPALTLVRTAAASTPGAAASAAGAAASVPGSAASSTSTATSAPAAPAWRAEGWQEARAFDPAKAAALADRIARLEVDGLAPAASTSPAAPALQLRIADSQGKSEVWALTKVGDAYRLQVSGLPWLLQLQPWNAKPLLDACAAGALAKPAATK